MVNNRTRKPRTVTAPVARAKAPGRSSRFPPVPFTGTERLVTVRPTSGDFIRSFDWNPGLSETFLSAAPQAKNFDKYSMYGRNTVRYTPSCSTLTSGSIYILIDYDPNDPAPATEDEFANNELTKTCAMYSSMSAPIERAQMDTCKMLIRTGPSRTDKLLTDACTIHIGAFGFNSESQGLALGHIHIDYQAKLHVRQPAVTAPPQPRNVLSMALVGGEIPSGINSTLFEGPLFNTIGATIDGGNILLPRGAYNVHARLGLTIPQQSGTVFVRLRLLLNGNLVPQSQSDFNEIPTAVRTINLDTDRIVVVETDSVLQLQLEHDHTSTVRVSNSRSLFTAELI